jgi:hypothetical protein
VLAGSTDPSKIIRPKIRRILTDSPALRSRLEQARAEQSGRVIFKPEDKRVSKVVIKLAQGHALYELHEPCAEPPTWIHIAPLERMSESEREDFEVSVTPPGWPEVGSRAMQRLVIATPQPDAPWLVVQDNLYRFHASPEPRATIRIVINEYLACLVRWD